MQNHELSHGATTQMINNAQQSKLCNWHLTVLLGTLFLAVRVSVVDVRYATGPFCSRNPFGVYKHQSNWVKREIAFCFYSPGNSSNFQLHTLAGGSTPNLSFSSGQGPHLTQRVIRPQKCTSQMASKSVERFKQGARM